MVNISNFLNKSFNFSPLGVNESGLIIKGLLETRSPFMVARFGSVEIKGVLYPRLPWLIRKALRHRTFSSMSNNAGFFSVSEENIKFFSEQMIKDMQLVDALGSWRVEEVLLKKYLESVIRLELDGLEPYYSDTPWSEGLKGLRVLVIHPFSKTIECQYLKNREKIFDNKNILPEFRSFQTIRAVQTIAGNKGGFDNWFDALQFMKSEIDERDFDVALIGCGAYGFPLAAHVKRIGKQAIHLGGATQILFGIKGRRWDSHPIGLKFYNEYWVRPLPEDVPNDILKVENGCYW